MAHRERWTSGIQCLGCGATGTAAFSEEDHPYETGDTGRIVFFFAPLDLKWFLAKGIPKKRASSARNARLWSTAQICEKPPKSRDLNRLCDHRRDGLGTAPDRYWRPRRLRFFVSNSMMEVRLGCASPKANSICATRKIYEKLRRQARSHPYVSGTRTPLVPRPAGVTLFSGICSASRTDAWLLRRPGCHATHFE
jgi:hypothetical protein